MKKIDRVLCCSLVNHENLFDLDCEFAFTNYFFQIVLLLVFMFSWLGFTFALTVLLLVLLLLIVVLLQY